MTVIERIYPDPIPVIHPLPEYRVDWAARHMVCRNQGSTPGSMDGCGDHGLFALSELLWRTVAWSQATLQKSSVR